MVTPVNIALHLTQMAIAHPAQLAVMVPLGHRSNGQRNYASYTYQQLDEQSDLLAAGLDANGIGRGVRTVLMVPPSLEFFSLTFALFKLGAVPVFVDPGMGIKNLGRCLAEADPAAFIGVTKAQIARVLFGWGKSSLSQVVTVGRRLGWGGLNLTAIKQAGQIRQSLYLSSVCSVCPCTGNDRHYSAHGFYETGASRPARNCRTHSPVWNS